jgi:hypothetical protein
LFDEIRVSPIDVSDDEVSTKTIFVPPCCTLIRSELSAAESVGATSSAFGLVTAAVSISGFCSGILNEAGPVTVRLTPSFFASRSAPHSIVT